MTAIVIAEIVICILLALGIAAGALVTFIRGRNKRPSLLIASSTAAVVLLVGCIICAGIQIGKGGTEASAAEFEELKQVRVESVGKEEKTSQLKASASGSKTAANAKNEKKESEAVNREQTRADLLAAYFGSSSNTKKAGNAKTVSSSDNSDAKVYYDFSTSPKYDDNLPAEEDDSDLFYFDDTLSDDEYDAYYEEQDSSEDYDWIAANLADAAENSSSDDGNFGWYDEEDYSAQYTSGEDNYTWEENDSQDDYIDQEEEQDSSYSDNISYEDNSSENESSSGEDAYTWDGSVLSNMSGVNWGPIGKETYYNMDMSGVVGVMRGMGFSEEEYPYYVREDGCKMLGPYIMVAANLNHFPRGSIVQCSLGAALVCDTGGFAYSDVGWNQLDIATNW